jgi:hypothetical protein
MLDGDELTITGDWGAERKLPFRGDWLRLGRPESKPAAKAVDWEF